mmetsp:Transcript_21172/g.59557  ORF Transcript_21172/g.59557 Transcript_21172/m.59557 type:complete len:428 (+) Transcript_21172:52-1335(+)
MPPIGVSYRVTLLGQCASSTKIVRLRVCLCLCLTMACGSHAEAAPPEANLSLVRGSADASRYESRDARRLAIEGFHEFTLEHGGASRYFQVYVPSTVTSANPASGLAMFFHGKGGSVFSTCGGTQASSFLVKPQADTHNFIAVCPEGRSSSERDAGWNCQACCGYPAVSNIDDVGFVSAMLDHLGSAILPTSFGVAYPTRNVFAFGFSTGGLFSYRLACDLPDKIDGAAPSGATFNHAFGARGAMQWASGCSTSVPVWSSIGTEDAFTTAAEAAKGFAQYAGGVLRCPSSSCRASAPEAGVECLGYAACGGGAKAKLCVYDGARHRVRPLRDTYDHGHVSEAWDFLTSAGPATNASSNGSCDDNAMAASIAEEFGEDSDMTTSAAEESGGDNDVATSAAEELGRASATHAIKIGVMAVLPIVAHRSH